MLSKRTVHKVRMLVIQGCRSGQPVYSKEIRTFISDETAKEGRRVVLGRQQLQALRDRMGLVYGGKRASDGAKESFRVRLSRWHYCSKIVERLLNPQVPADLLPIEAHSDETYINANHSAEGTWGLTEKAWADAMVEELVERAAQGEDIAQAHVSLVGLAEGSQGKNLVRVDKPKSGKGARAVVVDMITESGRVKRTVTVDGQQQKVPVGKVWAASSKSKDYHSNFSAPMYLFWFHKDAIPGLIELSQEQRDRPVWLTIDKAPYHVSMGPGSIQSADLRVSRPLLNQLCELFDFTHEMAARATPPVKKLTRLKGDSARPWLDYDATSLAEYVLTVLMPPQRTELEILWSERTKHLAHGDKWEILYEPSYHYYLQVRVRQSCLRIPVCG